MFIAKTGFTYEGQKELKSEFGVTCDSPKEAIDIAIAGVGEEAVARALYYGLGINHVNQKVRPLKLSITEAQAKVEELWKKTLGNSVKVWFNHGKEKGVAKDPLESLLALCTTDEERAVIAKLYKAKKDGNKAVTDKATEVLKKMGL